jgi:hypothetical protein
MVRVRFLAMREQASVGAWRAARQAAEGARTNIVVILDCAFAASMRFFTQKLVERLRLR